MNPARKAALGGAALLAVLAAYSMLAEPGIITTEIIEIPGTGLGMTIVFLADFQRNNADPAFVQRAAEIAGSHDPDLVLLGGDYVEDGPSELGSVGPLRDIGSEYGTYGVMGNHDYGARGYARDAGGDQALAGEIIEFLESEGSVRILRNEKVTIDGRLTVIGLDELWAHLRDESVIGGKDGYTVVLSHNQEGLDIKKGDADLYLFGHTHCGQVRLPGVGSVPKLLGFPGEYDGGHHVLEDGAHVYTTCGLTPGPRLLNPPQVSVIRLG